MSNEISEVILVGGQEVLADEIVDIWYSSKDGHYLQLKGNRTIPIPNEEAQRVRDFFEHLRDVAGNYRKLSFSCGYVFENEIAEVIYQDKTPFLKLTDGRILEIKPAEADVAEHFVNRNKKLKGEY